MKDQASLPLDRAEDRPDLDFVPTRKAGLDRLEAFAPKAGRNYAARRNHDLPGHPHVSSLSPYIRHRVVTEAETCAAILDRFAPSTAEKFLQEVCWRTYFKGWLERRPAVWTAYRAGVERGRNRLATESGLRREWEAACKGETGIEPFDHWARELVQTGYLHNHARMWFASIWMHTLRLPWELGADFFLRHLLDGDPASNTLSWRWVAGLHTKGKTYRARASNIGKYTDGRFDAATLGHQLATDTPVPDDAPHPDPIAPPDDADWQRGVKTGLLLHDDDLHPDYLFARGLDAVATSVLTAAEGRSPFEVSGHVLSFTRALAEDACERLGKDCCTPISDVDAIAAWAQAAGLDQIVTPYAPVGPVRDRLDRLDAALDIPVIRPVRAWDQRAWPHCTAGFFKLKKKIPDLMESIPEDMVA
ncbi:FAD-binding domain-containing protein [Jannaschia aquimarina]|uniref:PhrA protein n=1 Tax=Jannaschia aquimarina TaxID=935700 RepID=A0A0D1D391_9RHOB|nr:FAD-binding domain-containing protein [Jannaschia aquimarina]KIT14588.1 Deoxyribodipyrimidine photo-lyase [Jannaschia aquimarina]SNS96726.1 deoxyribodipyrimidine photo-lyase [Jannaschia aquimarina]